MTEGRGKFFIFVGGAPRSGTTLVQNMLDSHPDILGGPEFMHLPDIIQLRKKMYDSVKKRRIDLYCSYEDIDKHIRTLIEAFLLPFMEKYGSYILSEKTPGNVLVFTELMDLFPESKFIHVLRDPRAIVASMLQVGKRAKKVREIRTQNFTHRTSSAINYIKSCLEKGFAAEQKAPARIITVTYERMVAEPVLETKRICKFLDLEWSSDMVLPQDKMHLAEKSTTRFNVWYDQNSFNRAPVTTEIKKWETQLSQIQKAVILRSFQGDKELGRFGYDFSLDNIRITDRIIYVIIGAVWRFIYNIFRNFYILLRKIHQIFYFKIQSPKI